MLKESPMLAFSPASAVPPPVLRGELLCTIGKLQRRTMKNVLAKPDQLASRVIAPSVPTLFREAMELRDAGDYVAAWKGLTDTVLEYLRLAMLKASGQTETHFPNLANLLKKARSRVLIDNWTMTILPTLIERPREIKADHVDILAAFVCFVCRDAFKS